MRLATTAVVLVSAASTPCAAQATTTVITHGFSPNEKGAWVQGLAEAIVARANGVGAVYRYTGATGVWTRVDDAGGDGSPEHVVLIFNWVPESDGPDSGPNWNFVQAAGDALHAMLRDPAYASGESGPDELLVAGRAVQFIGHSRGACVISEAIRRLALAGIPVDQMTTHDPHPTNGTLDSPYNPNWGDPVPVRWSNVAWADTYWRADGGGFINGLDFDGIPLAHTFNTNLSESALSCCGYAFSHSDVHLWYHGTVDLAQNPSDGEQDITDQMRSTWWPQGFVEKGFFYSALGGGAARRPSIDGGVDPPADSAPVIFNGAFEAGTQAGWAYHGGGGVSVINGGAGNWFARLANASPAFTHNRAFLPDGPLTVTVNLRRAGSALTDDVVRIALQRAEDPQPVTVAAAAWPASELTTTFRTFSALVPPEFAGGTVRLSVVLDGAAGGITALVDVDDIAITPAVLSADLNGDALVNGTDLALLLGNWAGSGVGDINGDGTVDAADLAILLGNWTG